MSDKKPKIGVVGAGHLGKHHIKHLSNHSGVEFVGVFDINTESLKYICSEFSVNALQSIEETISSCDAVHIVTPTNTHFDIAKKFLDHKKDVFIEKPITSTVEEASYLINLAKKMGVLFKLVILKDLTPQLIGSKSWLTIHTILKLKDLRHFKQEELRYQLC